MSPRRLTALALTTIALFIGAVVAATPADAATSDVQTQINQVIAEHGGTQTAWNQVSWDEGAIVLTVVAEAGPGIQAQAIGPCATGKYCVYSGAGYTGSNLTYSTCTTGNSVSALPQVRSIANSRSTGTVRAYNGTTVVATVNANTGKTPITGTTTTVSCS